MQKSPSENVSTKNRRAVPTAWKAVLIFAAFFQGNLSRADERAVTNRRDMTYLRDMRILACVKAENAVRERLKNEGRVGFESCASDKFDVDLGSDDRNYRVSGNATVLSPDARPVVRRFSVSMNHDPGAYRDRQFDVTRIEIDP